jgi:Mn2+/Fe2+ NRAMP family transporter
MLISQATNGILLPFVLIFMLLLVNNKRLMGSYTNSRIYNLLAVIVVAAMIILSLLLLKAQFL